MKKLDPERALEFLGKIRECLVIVEGKKDVKALNTLGITDIIPINGKPLIKIVQETTERIAAHRYSDIIILSDFDREGRNIAAKLQTLLRAHRIHPNQRLRSRIMNFGFNKVEDITLFSITGKREGDSHVKTGTDVNEVRHKGKDKGKGSSGEA